jgi:bacterial/archaeal transporter family-2 protein
LFNHDPFLIFNSAKPINMPTRLLFVSMALGLGAILIIQAAINARLAKEVGGSVMAAFISFAVGTVALFIFLLVTGQLTIPAGTLSQSPWWIWIGGLLGTFFVAGIVVLLPRLGAALSFSLVVAGQMAAALLFDHFGLLGVAVREMSWGKLVGALLLVAGVVLIRKF